MMQFSVSIIAAAAGFFSVACAQTYQRLGTCPTLGCVFPPDQQDFLAGQYFDIRVEVHAPINGSEKTNGIPDINFSLTIGKRGAKAENASTFLSVVEPMIETWDFSWFE